MVGGMVTAPFVSMLLVPIVYRLMCAPRRRRMIPSSKTLN